MDCRRCLRSRCSTWRREEGHVSTCVEGEHECMAAGMDVADKEAGGRKRKRLRRSKRKVVGCKER